jgi:hypothetical protein
MVIGGYAHTLAIRIVRLQASGNLFLGPVQDQFIRNDSCNFPLMARRHVLGRKNNFLGLVIRLIGSILRMSTIAGHLPVHH